MRVVPVLKELLGLVFPLRLGRLNYLWRALLMQYATVLSLADAISAVGPEQLKAVGLLLLVLLYLTLFVYMPRMHDAGMRRIWVFLTLVPVVSYVVGIFLLFKASDAGIGSWRNEAEGEVPPVEQ